LNDEKYDLRGHEALDLARLHFIHDVTRLEDWTADQPDTNGVAVLLTNDNRLWEVPSSTRLTRDSAFRLHQGRTLTGTLAWGTSENPFPGNERSLRGAYNVDWQEYSRPNTESGGTFRMSTAGEI
jgi:hypothetical protein